VCVWRAGRRLSLVFFSETKKEAVGEETGFLIVTLLLPLLLLLLLKKKKKQKKQKIMTILTTMMVRRKDWTSALLPSHCLVLSLGMCPGYV
jgi:hypothetical protein